jgi:hypothetical protein
VLRDVVCSPVPTQTIFGSVAATAISPIEITGWSSKIGSQLMPLLADFQRPPEPVAA